MLKSFIMEIEGNLKKFWSLNEILGGRTYDKKIPNFKNDFEKAEEFTKKIKFAVDYTCCAYYDIEGKVLTKEDIKKCLSSKNFKNKLEGMINET